jgi:predicted dehydrogenase
MPEPIEAILIGAGQRGALDYAPYALKHPDRLKFTAVAEPNPERRAWFAAQHQILPENVYESWEPLLERPRFAQAALICTQDQQHTGPAVAALQAGYHVLLEKPIATKADECRLIVNTARLTGRQLHIAHVLRYTRHYQAMRRLIHSGILGEVINVSHRENVSFFHMAHSYVRGNWANWARSSPMILAKCCHDFDILLWILDRKCHSLSSTGDLVHFRSDKAPAGAPPYCLDGCPAADTCPYYAPFVYLDLTPLWREIEATASGLNRLILKAQLHAPAAIKALGTIFPILRQISDYRGWPRSAVADHPTRENLLEALRKGPYGRCVYHCDNDVVDHQVVLMTFEDGPSVTLTMHGHSNQEGRSDRIEGSRASLYAHLGRGGSWIEVREHTSGRRHRYNTSALTNESHGGGDSALMHAFTESLRSGSGDATLITAEQALESHLMAFSAEQARLERRWIGREEFSVHG